MSLVAVPTCQVCAEIADENLHEACMLSTVVVNIGASKKTKWMLICENHYQGGPAFLLTPIPGYLLKKDR